MKKTIFTMIAVSSVLAFVSCGKDSSKVDQGSAEYFSQFATSNNGIPMGEDLQISSVTNSVSGNGYYGYYNSQSSTTDIRLRIDTDGTFFLYRKPTNNFFLSQNEQENFRYNGLVGNWKLEGMKLVLDNVGQTADYNINTSISTVAGGFYSNQNVNQYEYSSKCFTVEIRSTIKLDTNVAYDNGVRQETDALSSGQIAKFCRP